MAATAKDPPEPVQKQIILPFYHQKAMDKTSKNLPNPKTTYTSTVVSSFRRG